MSSLVQREFSQDRGRENYLGGKIWGSAGSTHQSPAPLGSPSAGTYEGPSLWLPSWALHCAECVGKVFGTVIQINKANFLLPFVTNATQGRPFHFGDDSNTEGFCYCLFRNEAPKSLRSRCIYFFPWYLNSYLQSFHINVTYLPFKSLFSSYILHAFLVFYFSVKKSSDSL